MFGYTCAYVSIGRLLVINNENGFDYNVKLNAPSRKVKCCNIFDNVGEAGYIYVWADACSMGRWHILVLLWYNLISINVVMYATDDQ